LTKSGEDQTDGGAGPGSPASLPVRTGTTDVFISYASADKAAAESICAALEHSDITCWIAPRDVKPGALYADAIVRAIAGAKAFVLVLSESAIASSHVGKEVERASSKRRPIIALRIDATPLTPALEYFLSESQWIDASTANRDIAYAKLIDAIRDPQSTVPGGTTAVTTPGPSISLVLRPKLHRNRKVLLAALAIVAATLAGLFAARLLSSRRPTAEKSPTTITNVVSDRSIAVLPFDDLSEKKDQEYFADGIAEEALDRLAKVPGLRVVGRASSFQFKGKITDAARVGAALGVAYILEGGVRRETGRVRVTAQLVEVRTGAQRWSDRFDSDLTDVLNVQDTIAAEIARALQLAVEGSTAPRSTVKSPEALEVYLRGLHSLDRFTQEGCEEAVAHFQQALAEDPTFAAAATGIARAYVFIGAQGWLPPKVAFERARDAAQLALQLDPKSPRPHAALAEIHLIYDWDWAGVDRELQQASALGSRDTYRIRIASRLAAAQGHWDEARQLGIEAIALDPLDPEAQGALGWAVYARYGHLAEAEQSLRRSLQIAPQWGSGRYFLGEVLMLQGHLDAALTVFRQETLDDGQLEGSAMVHFAAGRKADSDARLADAIGQNGSSWPSEIARVYAFRGEKDHAFEWLTKAYDMHDEDLYFIKGDPLLKNIESDPRFKAFLRKMNLPE
jgi:adenylate cyclase